MLIKKDSRSFTYQYNEPLVTIFNDNPTSYEVKNNSMLLFFGIYSLDLKKQK